MSSNNLQLNSIPHFESMKDLYWFMQGALAFSNLSHEQREAKLHSCAEHATNLARSINADESPERLEIIMQKLRGMNQSSTLKGPKEAFECEDCGKMEWLNWITCDID